MSENSPAPSPTARIGYCADVVYAADECFIVTAVVRGHYGRVPLYVNERLFPATIRVDVERWRS